MDLTPTPHIGAKKEEIAKTVLMPGDPLRAKYIAEHYLENAKLVNEIRGMLGFTGTYHGKPVTVMGSGMGMPSMGLYSYELYHFYDVDRIIRIGTCGGISPDLHVRDMVLVQGTCTDGNYAFQYRLPGTFAPIADFSLLRRAVELCEERKLNYRVGNIVTSNYYYNDANSDMEWGKMGVLGVDMEAAALYCNAARAGKKALCICTVSNSFPHPEEDSTAEERQNSFTDMMEVALGL